MTELLLGSDSISKQQHLYVETIYQSGTALLSLINDILDISKIEAGKMELDAAPFDLIASVEDSLIVVAETAHAKGLELICDVAQDMNNNLIGDQPRLKQVLINLVGNAVKFTESGEIIVRVKEIEKRADASVYRFEVQDTGKGIDPAKQGTIFELFSQEDSSTTRVYGGTGLGLSICAEFVKMFKGDIGLESKPGTGSTFWFTAEFQTESAVSPVGKLISCETRNVLIVDDNLTNRHILRSHLEGWGVKVKESSSGAEALEYLNTSEGKEHTELVLLDMQMPEMDGIEVAQSIRRNPALQNLKLIMLSSISRGDLSDEQCSDLFSAWLTKPVRVESLIYALQSVVDNPPAEPESEPSNSVDTSTIRVLLVEDNILNQKVAGEMLSRLGCSVEIASGGEEALDFNQNENFDLIFMDCQMPTMDGYETSRRIRIWEEENQRPRIPIVALTANALKGDREICLEAGMSDYATKPVTMDTLRQAMDANISGAHC